LFGGHVAAQAVIAAYRTVAFAVQRIDMSLHEGVHPCVGAADVVPFVPLVDEEPSPSVSPSFSFIVYGDIQENHQNSHQALIEHMLLEDAAFVVNTGDISRDDGRHYTREFYPVIQKLAQRMPFFPALGNHDVDWGSPVSRFRFSNFFTKPWFIFPPILEMPIWVTPPVKNSGTASCTRMSCSWYWTRIC
ncbi:MAG: metallophosphoesterase, partial [Acidobacteria bacterium]|nr:metallophosphoesterase [Acidobacteriota bacterium]